jgi:hypothetical protein
MIQNYIKDRQWHANNVSRKKDIHAGSVETSAETAQATPRFVKAPRISPQGK